MKKIIVLGILIAFILVFVTAILIFNENYKNLTAEKESGDVIETVSKPVPILYKEFHTPIKDGIKGAKIGDKYNTNSLRWERVFYEDSTKAGYYYQISGLKNKDVESTVNDKLKKSALEYGKVAYEYLSANQVENDSYYDYKNYKKYIDGKAYEKYEPQFKESKNWKAFFNQCSISSFSNVISVATGNFDTISYENYTYSRKEDMYVNIDLNTGEDLSFESIFSEDADILTIVRNLLYVELPIYDSYTYEEDYWRDENGNIEYYDGEAYTYAINQRYEEIDFETLDRMMKQFKYTEDLDFFFAPNSFGLHLGDKFLIGYYANYDGQIAIFNRYVSDESIFESNKYAINDLAAYYDYLVDNVMKKHVKYMNSDGVIYSYNIYSQLDENNPEENEILQKAMVKIDDRIREEVQDLKKLKNDNQIIYYKSGYVITLPKTKNDYRYSSIDKSFVDAINNQIDDSIKLFEINSYDDYGYYRMTKSQYDDGMIEKLDKIFVLREAMWGDYWKEYEETYKLVEDIGDEYAKSKGFDEIYRLRSKAYYGAYYKVEDGEQFNNPLYYLQYILKDGSEEGIARFVQAVCEYEKELARVRNWSDSSEIYNGIDSGNYGILEYYIRFYYNSSRYGQSYTSFDFITDGDTPYKPYPVNDNMGI